MYLPGSGGQAGLHRSFRADGSLTSSVTPLLILPQTNKRAQMMTMNISGATMWMEHGPARAKATITNGVVTSIAMLNVGFGYTLPPSVQFMGGGSPLIASAATWDGRGLPDFPGPLQSGGGLPATGLPNRQAYGVAVLSGNTVNSITIIDGGGGYINPPEIVLTNHPNDPFGCADPSIGGGSGVLLGANGGYYATNSTAVWMDAVALFGTSGSKFYVEYML